MIGARPPLPVEVEDDEVRLPDPIMVGGGGSGGACWRPGEVVGA